tara:strand:+ start:1989 stop:2312 length:324 start_codon:yes stop_codon:yes gene_type:complete
LRRDFSVNERACGTKKRHKIGFPLARRGGWRHLFCPSRATERYNNDDDNNNNNNTLFKGLMFCVNRYALFIFEFFFSSFFSSGSLGRHSLAKDKNLFSDNKLNSLQK